MSYGLLVLAAFMAVSATRQEFGAEVRITFAVVSVASCVMAMIAGFNNY